MAVGMDAAHYLRFHVGVLLMLCLMTVFGLCVLLPIYLTGSGIDVSASNVTTRFDVTTASNLPLGSPSLWAAVVSVMLNSSLCWLLVLWMFRVQSRGSRAKMLSRKDFTLHLRHFPRDVLDEGLLSEWFWEAFEVRVEDAVISPDLDVLHAKHRECKRTLANLERARVYNSMHAPARSTRWSVFKCQAEDAEQFYEREKERLQREIQLEHKASRGTGHAFVTFGSLPAVRKVLSYFASIRHARGRLPPRLLEGRFARLVADQWSVVMAPNPRDLVHKNLASGVVERWARMIFINVVLAAVMMFFTTPIALFGLLGEITNADVLAVLSTKLAEAFSFFGDATTVSGFISSLLMIVFTFVIPRVMALAARLERHHTRSHTQMSVVRKIYAYLFLCIVLMPAMFMTSVDAVIKFWLQDCGWQILRDLGGVIPRAIFFINYLLAIGLVSNFFELLNFPGSLVSWWRRRNALTSYERRRARKSARSKFQLGYEYAYQMVLLTMTMLFSTMCPVLVPFGLFAFATKHFVDRQNLIYVYAQPHTNTKIVRIVLTQVVIGTAFYQLAMMCFFLFNKEDQTKAVATGMLLAVSVVVGMYVRFWTVSSRLRFDFEEGEALITRAMLDEASYRDRILSHDVVQDFYSSSTASLRGAAGSSSSSSSHASTAVPSEEMTLPALDKDADAVVETLNNSWE